MEIIFLKLIVNSNKQPNGCFFYKLKDIIREDTKEEIEMIISTLSSYIVKAQENLAKAAEKLGANAVLGVCFDLRDSNKPVLMGTAVVLEDLE